MGNPISDLWGAARGIWSQATRAYVNTWRDMYDVLQLSQFETAARDAITALSEAFEAESVLSAVSDADNVQIGRDESWGVIENLRHLAWPVLPRWGVLAAQWADRVALVRARQAMVHADQLVNYETHLRVKGDQQVMAWVNDQAGPAGYDTARSAAARGLAATLGRLLGNDHVDKVIVDAAIRLLTLLATIDLPELRPEIGRLVSLILRFTGLDSDLAGVISGQLDALTGAGQPKTLAAAEHDTAVRLARLEETAGALTDTLAPLKDESGALREMGKLGFDAALLGWLAAGIAEPRAWADDTARILDTIAGPVMEPLYDLLGAPGGSGAAAAAAETPGQVTAPSVTSPAGPVTWQVTAVVPVPPPGRGTPPVAGSDVTVATSNGWTLHVFATRAQLADQGAVTALADAAVRGALAAAAAAHGGPAPAAG